MTSVERVFEYTRADQEPPLESPPENKPPPSWPTKGAISFQDVVLRYDPTADPVLHGVNFTIKPQEKVWTKLLRKPFCLNRTELGQIKSVSICLNYPFSEKGV